MLVQKKRKKIDLKVPDEKSHRVFVAMPSKTMNMVNKDRPRIVISFEFVYYLFFYRVKSKFTNIAYNNLLYEFMHIEQQKIARTAEIEYAIENVVIQKQYAPENRNSIKVERVVSCQREIERERREKRKNVNCWLIYVQWNFFLLTNGK